MHDQINSKVALPMGTYMVYRIHACVCASHIYIAHIQQTVLLHSALRSMLHQRLITFAPGALHMMVYMHVYVLHTYTHTYMICRKQIFVNVRTIKPPLSSSETLCDALFLACFAAKLSGTAAKVAKFEGY